MIPAQSGPGAAADDSNTIHSEGGPGTATGNPGKTHTESDPHTAADGSGMTHAEFVAAWREGRISVAIDSAAAAAFLSARLLLPFVAIAIIGGGIALVLLGWIWAGIAVGAAAIVVPRLIKRGARRFLLSQIATDADLYAAGVAAGVIGIVPNDNPGRPA
ncbi:MAG: hypothetical protein ACREUX_06165 [Burkholderiales bacterium]